MSDDSVLLVAGVSVRALAFAARRAGFAPIAIDAFGDSDTREACLETLALPAAIDGFAGVDIKSPVGAYAREHAPIGLVYGAGFDDCPEQLSQIATATAVLGTTPRALARAKHPRGFAVACEEAGVAHPEVAFAAPTDPAAWLVKRHGGSGGLHVRDGERGRALGVDEYWQRRVEGRSRSLLFVRDAKALTPIAWSEQWTSPSADAPFRYGGAAGPIDAPTEDLRALSALAAALDVRGLASADFVDDGERLWLLEINPRPGATLDLFDDETDPLLARHLAALSARPQPSPKARSPRASEIVYADAAITAPAFVWPDWAADRPAPGTHIPRGAPVCTVSAAAADVPKARVQVQARARQILSALRGSGE